MKPFFVSIFLYLISFLHCQTVVPLSQNTNTNITQSSDGLSYISSLEGLNIFDGQHTKVYRPTTHNMFGKNIQSQFYEDENRKIWFCTYKALHFYDPEKDDLEYFFLTDEDGNEITAEYRIIDLIGDNLWVHTPSEIQKWNILTKRVIEKISSPFESIVMGSLNNTKQNIVLIANDGRAACINLESDSLAIFPIPKQDGYISCTYDKERDVYYLGDINGVVQTFDYRTRQIISRFNIGNSQCYSMNWIEDNLIGFSFVEGIKILKIVEGQLAETATTIPNLTNSSNYFFVKRYGSNLWIGDEKYGVSIYPYLSKKFKHKLRLKDGSFPSITSIIPLENTIVATTKSNGLILTNVEGDFLEHISSHGLNNKFPIQSSARESNNTVIFSSVGTLFRFDVETKNISLLKNQSSINFNFMPSIIPLNRNQYLCSTYDTLLYKLIISDNEYRFEPLDDPLDNISTNIKEVNQNLFLVSINEEYLLLISLKNMNLEILDRIEVTGGVKSITSNSDKSFYFTNENGIFLFDLATKKHNRLVDKNGVLNQTVYKVFLDENENLWCSTNTGIVFYDASTNVAKKFNELDGVQSNEFNTHAYAKLHDGTILFGGINGLNIFHPDSIKLSQKHAPIILSDYKINDESSTIFGVPLKLQEIVVNYSQNTLSFSFHALDYSNPEVTRVKYQLIGEDEDYVISSSAKGEVRYANLDPGEYTFSMIGSNADGIWNHKDKTIAIRVLPPFWQTWWFRLGAIIIIGGIIYLIVRNYYNQKLARKDFELREQSLIIEKQNALTAERTRIAGEMHDDLGGGLTTIKFLSQKLQRKIPDETHKTQLDKIVQHSQSLVNNMSEIIWAMNAGFDTLRNLIAYSRRFAFEYLEPYDIDLSFNVEGDINDIELTGEKRRNLFLIIKEALHNTVKYSKSAKASISFKVEENHLHIHIADEGIGFSEQNNKFGNGLKNMRQRVEQMNGEITIDGNDGVVIEIKQVLT